MSANGRRRRPAAALVLIGLILMAGCGKGDKADEHPAPLSYVPDRVGAPDTAVADSAAGEVPAGTAAVSGGAATGSVPAAPGSETAPVEETLSSAPADVTPPQPAPRPRDAAREPTAGGAFSLQLGSFRSLDNARALLSRVETLGYDPVLESVVLGGQTYHRVLLRGLADRAAASRTGEALRAELGITYLIRQSD